MLTKKNNQINYFFITMNSLEYNNNSNNFIRKKINLPKKATYQFSKNNYSASNNNNYSRNFWRKHCLVVALDVSEILDRVFCQCGLDQTLQVPLNLVRAAAKSRSIPHTGSPDLDGLGQALVRPAYRVQLATRGEHGQHVRDVRTEPRPGRGLDQEGLPVRGVAGPGLRHGFCDGQHPRHPGTARLQEMPQCLERPQDDGLGASAQPSKAGARQAKAFVHCNKVGLLGLGQCRFEAVASKSQLQSMDVEVLELPFISIFLATHSDDCESNFQDC